MGLISELSVLSISYCYIMNDGLDDRDIRTCFRTISTKDYPEYTRHAEFGDAFEIYDRSVGLFHEKGCNFLAGSLMRCKKRNLHDGDCHIFPFQNQKEMTDKKIYLSTVRKVEEYKMERYLDMIEIHEQNANTNPEVFYASLMLSVASLVRDRKELFDFCCDMIRKIKSMYKMSKVHDS